MDDKRLGRISQEIKKAISRAVFYELQDPNIAPVLTISEVKVSGDLSYADIFLSVLGTEWERRQTLESLERAKGFLRNAIARNVKLRLVPELRFHEDLSIERGMYMDQLIKKTLEADHKAQAAREEEEGGSRCEQG